MGFQLQLAGRKREHLFLMAVALLVAALNCPRTLIADDADVATVVDRYTQALIPQDKHSADELIAAARDHANSLTSMHVWPDIDYAARPLARWPIRDHLARTLLMAKASRILRERGQTDVELETKMLGALDWSLVNDPKNPNWWWNQIGVPMGIGEIALFARPHLSQEQLRGVGKIMKRSDWKRWTGQNLVWGVGNQIVRGCVENDPNLIAQAYARLWDEVRVVDAKREGIQADDSFHQHGRQLYSGGYGLAFAQDVGRYLHASWGTKFQPTEEVRDVFSRYILDGQQWMTYGDIFDYSTTGREITVAGKVAVRQDWTGGPYSPRGTGYSFNNALRLLAELELPRKAEFQSYADRLASVQDAVPFVGNKHFWDSDYMAHRRPGYLFSIKMFSNRLQGAELIIKQGKKSHHLSDGATMLYRRGDEFLDIFPTWDWERVPGTTAEQAPDGDLERLLPKGNRSRGETRFVGGVSNGSIGMAAMDLKRGHLRARKAWVCLDDVIVCLGAAITCESDNPVLTSVNQCLAKGAVVAPPGGSWVWHDGVGYDFPQDQKFRASTSEQSGHWSNIGTGPEDLVTCNVFSVLIDHGARVRNGSYQYLIIPAINAADMPAYVEHRRVKIVSNTADLQAVSSEDSGGIFAAAFFQPGKADSGLGFTIAVDQSCLALLTRDDQGLALTISNPINEPGIVNVTLNNENPVGITLPSGLAAGSSVTIRPSLQKRAIRDAQ